ncbi:MAG: class I SAM-dependent RNA methyltransferase [Oscillospiraceae bacterium]|nr:class I SAM-dependent RNA methyltransferase [Oscillospiraceae bacterium]
MEYTYIAPCYFGVESAAAFDVKRIGAKEVTVTDGRVSFKGDGMILAKANIHMRCAERVLLLLKTQTVKTFDELFDMVYALPWEDIMPSRAAFLVKGSSLSSVLSSVPACQSIVKKAMVERLKKGHQTAVLPEDGPTYKIRFSIRKDVCEIMLDTSGDGLHKRGYRKDATMAPLKETLAAAIADLARVRADSLVQDPFCGSGTLLIEAAMKAMHIAPGLKRRFLAEQYTFIPPEIWRAARAGALEEAIAAPDFKAVGFDIDPAAVDIANRNAKLAGVEEKVKFFTVDVKNFAPSSSAVILTNPPYGERLGNTAEAAALETVLGERLSESPVKGLYAITSDAEFETHFGKKADRRRKLYNGMIPCQVYMYFEKRNAVK